MIKYARARAEAGHLNDISTVKQKSDGIRLRFAKMHNFSNTYMLHLIAKKKSNIFQETDTS